MGIRDQKSESVTEGISRPVTLSYLEGRTPLLNAAYAQRWSSLRPMFAHLYVENRCHLKCAHCYETEETHPGHHRLELEEYASIFDGLARLGVLVTTFSGGEPFLRKDFLDIVELARKKRFAVRIYTSGTPITAEKADRIAALKVSEVHVSIYSHDPELHDAFTGMKGSHAKSVRALALLKERGVKTVLKSNVLNFNIDHLDELMALAREHGADYSFDPSIKPRMNGDTSPLQYACSPAEVKEKIYDRGLILKTMDEATAQAICDGESHLSGVKGMCAAARGLITIWADGSVAPCAMYPKAGGNHRDAPIEDIWLRSKLFDEVRNTQLEDMAGCTDCGLKGACHPCMAYGEVETGELYGCNTSSKHAAEAKLLFAKSVVKGTSLPIVD